ncbi:MAG: alpha-D-ribose 1-methylphosphonate 5-triphosphate diphosphatase [Pseudomonadota bacterium]
MTAIDLTFEGAEVLLPGGFSDAALALAEGVIADAPTGKRVDARGFRILPGIVDIHGDGFEKHLAPRRGAMTDMVSGMAAAEADLIASGITTAVMAQFYSWEGGLRSPEFARKFLDALDRGTEGRLIDLHAQLRFETHMLDDYDAVLDLVRQYAIRYVVFNDHLPHKRLDEGRKPPRLTGTALKSGRSPEAHLKLMQDLHGRSDEVAGALLAFAPRLAEAGCRIGSHDDNDPAQRSWFRALGARISEFPETRAVAEAARTAGDAVIMGAPNVMRRGSHAGNVSADELIADGLCDALASDYHYAAVRLAVRELVTRGMCSFETGWSLVSAGPARILGLTDRGTLKPGQRADILVEDLRTGRIAAVIAAGRIAHMQGDFAARVVG